MIETKPDPPKVTLTRTGDLSHPWRLIYGKYQDCKLIFATWEQATYEFPHAIAVTFGD